MSLQPADLTTAKGQVFIMSSPRHPQFRFEWHPGVSRVYVVRKGVVPEIGELVTPNVFDQEHARTCVLAYCVGYDAGAAKIIGRA